MKRVFWLAWICLGGAAAAPSLATAQTDRDIDQTSVRSPHVGLMVGGFAPQGDWATRYGFYGQMGVTAGLKTEGNGYLYLKATSWSGADVNEPGLLSDLMTPQGQIIDNEGDIAKITVTGRGGQFGLGLGKIFSTPWSNPNSGWMLKIGAGSLHHNVHFDYSENRISPLEDERVKGYDRMRWGAYGELWMGYWLMSNDQRINAFGGVSLGVAKTYSLRTQNFDTLDVNAPEAWDGWIGLEAGWIFHIYQRAAKEYWY